MPGFKESGESGELGGGDEGEISAYRIVGRCVRDFRKRRLERGDCFWGEGDFYDGSVPRENGEFPDGIPDGLVVDDGVGEGRLNFPGDDLDRGERTSELEVEGGVLGMVVDGVEFPTRG